jgi:hypothetical protein
LANLVKEYMVMGRRRPLVFLFAVLILSMPSNFLADEKADQDAVKKFKQYVSDLMARYKAGKHERTEHTSLCHIGDSDLYGYTKSAYEPGAYEFDVRRTDSLITPYVGTLELEWIQHRSGCQDTREEAQVQSVLPYSDSARYRYTYGFQEGKWIPKGSESGSVTDEGGISWHSCARERKLMEAHGYEVWFGCSVSY